MMLRWCLLLLGSVAWLQAEPSAAVALVNAKRVGCHNPKVKQGGLDLSAREGLLLGSEHGPVVTLGNPPDSTLYKVVAHITEPGMPFKGKKLSAAEIQIFEEWVKAGVPYGTSAVDPDAELISDAAKHWAFRVPTKGAGNSTDALVEAGRLKKGLKPVAEADKRTLLRRVYLDLIGLPPTPAEVKSFEEKGNYEQLVDSLLASPRYA